MRRETGRDRRRHTRGRAAWRRSTLVLVLSFAAVGAAGSAAPVMAATNYAALGDSFTAGPLIPSQVGPLLCLRSDHDYPALVAAAIGAGGFRDASCEGAAMYQFHGSGSSNQLDVLTSDTDVVTLQIAANDTHYAGALLLCSTVSVVLPIGAPCRDQYVTSNGDDLGGRIAAAGPALAGILQEIHARSPRARVLVLGYPAILPQTDSACWPSVPLTDGDVSYMRAKEEELNAMISTQAAANDAEYVDLYTRSLGHDMCQANGVHWVEGLIPTSSAAPVHPNALEMRDAAAAVQATLAQPPPVAPAACPGRHVTLRLRLRRGERLARAVIYLDSRRVRTVTKPRRRVSVGIPAGAADKVAVRARVTARRGKTTRVYTVRRNYHRCAP